MSKQDVTRDNVKTRWRFSVPDIFGLQYVRTTYACVVLFSRCNTHYTLELRNNNSTVRHVLEVTFMKQPPVFQGKYFVILKDYFNDNSTCIKQPVPLNLNVLWPEMLILIVNWPQLSTHLPAKAIFTSSINWLLKTGLTVIVHCKPVFFAEFVAILKIADWCPTTLLV